MPLKVSLLVALSGAVGVLARWLVDNWVQQLQWRHEWATFGVNVVGSFVAGFAVARLAASGLSPRLVDYLKPAIVTGFCGGLTTFSALSLQTFMWIQQRGLWGWLLPVAHVGFGIMALALGWSLGRG